jgi:hypothetical protein
VPFWRRMKKSMAGTIEDRRKGERYVISFPIRIKWKNADGKVVTQDGLTDNVGPVGTLVYLPRELPNVGSKVNLTVTENPKDEVTVTAQVIRLERNAAHPQVALELLDQTRAWKKKVWELARATIAAQQPEEFDDW